MSFSNWKQRCTEWKASRSHVKYLLENSQYTHIFHVLVFDFENFLQFLRGSSTQIFDISDFCHNTHAHLLIQSQSYFPGAKSIQTQTEYIQTRYKFFLTTHKRRHLLCNARFGIDSLKQASSQIILSNVTYLRDIQKMELPKDCIRQLFQQSVFDFQIPPYDKKASQSLSENFSFKEVDRKNVARLQHDFVTGPKIIVMMEIRSKRKCFSFCIHCIQLETDEFDIYYFWKHESDPSSWVWDPLYWCHACKQIPLFKLMTLPEFLNLYPMLPLEGNWIRQESFFKGTLCMVIYKSGTKLFRKPLIPAIPCCDCIQQCALSRWPFRIPLLLKILVQEAFFLREPDIDNGLFNFDELDWNEELALDSLNNMLSQFFAAYPNVVARNLEELKVKLLRVIGNPIDYEEIILECLAVVGKSTIPREQFAEVTDILMDILKEVIPWIERANLLVYPFGLQGTVRFEEGILWECDMEYF